MVLGIRMKKLIKSFLKTFIFAFFTFAFFAFASFASATDLVIICKNEGPCSDPGNKLFSQTNISPGDNFNNSITVINNDTDDDCSLVLDTKNEIDSANLATALFTVIRNGSTEVYGVLDGFQASSNKDLLDIFNAGGISLGTVPKSGTEVYDWTITFNPDASNSYQGKATKFDFDLNFSCGSSPGSPGPAASPSPSPVITSFGFPFFGGVVAGAATEASIEPSASVGELSSPQVKGESTSNNNYFWWLLLLILIILAWIYFYRTRK